jgi:hypothetical protein
MAEEPEVKAPEGSGGGLKAKLGKKIGPLPLGVWLVIAAGIFYYIYKKNNAGSSTSGQQTDPAGNVGTINPATGYVAGSAEDQAALSSGSSGLSTGSDSGSAGGSTVAGQYADNNAWAVAAINYLVSIGVDATSANTAVTQFLSSQTLTTQQQGEINLAIQRLGAPPSPPEPGGNTTPIVTPPSSATYATNPPTGFTTTTVTGTSIATKWNATTNAASYTLSWGTTSAATGGKTTVSTTAATATGLKPNTLYYLRVQANPVKSGAGFATLSKTTSKSSTTGTPKPKPPASGGHRTETISSAHPTLSQLVSWYNGQYKTHHTVDEIWAYNLAHRDAATVKDMKSRGKDKVFHGTTFWFPL